MTELAEIQELVGRAGTYAALRFSTDTAAPANGALLQKVRSGRRRSQTTLLFFELEWAALSDERAEELLAGEGLDFCRHYLRNARRYREHLLSEPEEKILAEKALTGASAWTRLFEELTSAIEVELPGGATVRRRSPRRGPRGLVARPTVSAATATAEAVTDALAPGCARGRSSSTRCWRQGRRRSPAPLSELAGGAQPVQRGQRRIRAGADRGGARTLRAAATLVSPEGQTARLERLADYDRMAAVTEDEVSYTSPRPGAGARLLLLVLAGAGRVAGASSTSDGSSAGASCQARRRLLRLGGALGVYPTCCSTTPRAVATC